MLFCCSGLMEPAAPAGEKAICVRFVLRGSICRTRRTYFFHPLTDRALNPCGRSVAARVGPALEKTLVINDDRCRVSHDPVKIANRLDAVAALL